MGEILFFLAVFCVGLIIFLFQLLTWTIPRRIEESRLQKIPCRVEAARLLSRDTSPSEADTTETPSTNGDGAESRNGVKAERNGLRREYRPEFDISYRFGADRTLRQRTLGVETDGEEHYLADKKRAEAILAAFPVGEILDCWVDRDNPETAYLLRDNPSWGWCVQGIALILVVFGAVGLWWALRFRSISEERRAARVNGFAPSPDASTTIPEATFINDSPGTHLAYRLPAVSQPTTRLFGIVVFAIVWNLAVWGGLLIILFAGGQDRADNIFTAIFGIAFCGFGVVLAIIAIHYLLQAFGCGPTLLEISDHPLYPGRNYRLILTQPGVFRVIHFELRLVCEEIARFRQGTDTITNRKEVFRQVLYERNDFETTADMPIQHEMLLRLPLGAMHSLRCESNEIRWKLVIEARLAGWPDLYRECPIIVNPLSFRDSVHDAW